MSAIAENGFKQTDVGLIPIDWGIYSLRELCDLYQPQTISASEMHESGFPVYGANGIVGFYKRWNHETWQVTVTCRGSTCGTVNRTTDYCWITGNAMVLNCEKSSLLNKEFFFHLIAGQDFSGCITGSGQPQIVRGPIANFQVALPNSLKEQKIIAETLNDVDTLITGLDQLIAKKRDIQQAAMQQLLTGQRRLPGFSGEWARSTMKSLGFVYGGLSGKTKVDFETGQYSYIPFMNVMSGPSIDCNWFELVNIQPDESQNRAQKGDLFFNGSSETPEEVGLCSVLLSDVHDLYLNSFCFGFRPHVSTKLNGLFMAYWFRSREGRNAMSGLAQGATRYNITKSAFLELDVPQPSLAEQTAIATVLSDMAAELSALEARRDKVRQLKQGMMQELLTGHIRLV